MTAFLDYRFQMTNADLLLLVGMVYALGVVSGAVYMGMVRGRQCRTCGRYLGDRCPECDAAARQAYATMRGNWPKQNRS